MNTKNAKRKDGLISSAIALGIFIAASFLGRIGSIFLYVASGYIRISGFPDAESFVGTALIILFTLLDHGFFSWLTVKLLCLYATKRTPLRMSVLLVSAAVILVFYAVELLLELSPGVLPVLAHLAGILLFGLAAIKQAPTG